MEKRVNAKVQTYLEKFHSEFSDYLNERISELERIKVANFLENYPKFEFDKDDFQKRKRVVNTVPFYDRCKARRANGGQCSRRRREGCNFCGTHTKTQPHGVIDSENSKDTVNVKKVTVWEQDINGIIYYIDNNNNVYDSVDIYNNQVNPRVIAKWSKDESGDYVIPNE
jgi:hypothetical protein